MTEGLLVALTLGRALASIPMCRLDQEPEQAPSLQPTPEDGLAVLQALAEQGTLRACAWVALSDVPIGRSLSFLRLSVRRRETDQVDYESSFGVKGSPECLLFLLWVVSTDVAVSHPVLAWV